MKKLLIFLASTAIGAVSGFFVGYKIAKKKYLAQADRDIQSVIDAYDEYYGVKTVKEETESTKAEEKPKNDGRSSLIDKDSIDYDELKNYHKNVEQYTKVKKDIPQQPVVQEEVNPDGENEKIYLITPEEYNNSDCKYSIESLTYYSDGVLADDDFNIISNINEVVGPKALESFGLYEQDVVYVRNDNYETDYEIVLDERSYAEVAPKGIYNSHPDED